MQDAKQINTSWAISIQIILDMDYTSEVTI